MAKAKKTTAETLKEEFETLSLDDKATFLVQATFSTAAATIEEIGNHISDLVHSMTEEAEEEHDDEAEEAEPAKKTTRSRSSSKGSSSTSRSSKKDDAK